MSKVVQSLVTLFLLVVVALTLLAEAPPAAPVLKDAHKTQLLALYRKAVLAQIFYNKTVGEYNATAEQLLKEDGFPVGSRVDVNSDADSVTAILPPPAPAAAAKPAEKK